jgi:hypothetical protein
MTEFNEVRVALAITTSILKKIKFGDHKLQKLPGKYAAQEKDTDMQKLLKRLAYIEKLVYKEEKSE